MSDGVWIQDGRWYFDQAVALIERAERCGLGLAELRRNDLWAQAQVYATLAVAAPALTDPIQDDR